MIISKNPSHEQKQFLKENEDPKKEDKSILKIDAQPVHQEHNCDQQLPEIFLSL